ncbi:PREDICTED: uncharacterized protein LOC104799781 isoform X2 [Tarenaya hassleriana]|uniref:uncharacterized protein LOC104799781 isoform X2 n=1 Tax=Tarenaya hassleriana TaxID=28532 RepID=UPI0008FD1A1F|nr:PREDICTED: uncharacterized protein LOC104799781 isoform X2 [Tarenaya hassleriana]
MKILRIEFRISIFSVPYVIFLKLHKARRDVCLCLFFYRNTHTHIYMYAYIVPFKHVKHCAIIQNVCISLQCHGQYPLKPLRLISSTEMIRRFKKAHANSHILKVDNFSLLKKYEVEEIESSVLAFGGHKWKLILYPNGNENDNAKGHISLYLEIQDSESLPLNWAVKIQFDIFILNQFRPFWKNRYGSVVFGPYNTKQGFARLISLSELHNTRQGYLVDDCALFGVKPYGVQGVKDGTAECFTLVEKPMNNKVTWKMTKFLAFDRFAKYKSHEFVVGNRKWSIEVHPRGFEEGKGNSLSVFLRGEGFMDNSVPNAKTYARYKLRVLDQINGNHVEDTCLYWIPVDPIGCGFVTLMPLKALHDPSKGYLLDDTLYVGVELQVVSVSNYC